MERNILHLYLATPPASPCSSDDVNGQRNGDATPSFFISTDDNNVSDPSAYFFFDCFVVHSPTICPLLRIAHVISFLPNLCFLEIR